MATASRNLIAHTDAVMSNYGPQTYPSFTISGIESANLVLQPRSEFVRLYLFLSVDPTY